MKIKRVNRGTAPSTVSSHSRKPSGSKSVKSKEPVRAGDVETLSQGARQAALVTAVEAAGDATSGRTLPDPRETSQAILEKELAAVFKEIYL